MRLIHTNIIPLTFSIFLIGFASFPFAVIQGQDGMPREVYDPDPSFVLRSKTDQSGAINGYELVRTFDDGSERILWQTDENFLSDYKHSYLLNKLGPVYETFEKEGAISILAHAVFGSVIAFKVDIKTWEAEEPIGCWRVFHNEVTGRSSAPRFLDHGIIYWPGIPLGDPMAAAPKKLLEVGAPFGSLKAPTFVPGFGGLETGRGFVPENVWNPAPEELEAKLGGVLQDSRDSPYRKTSPWILGTVCFLTGGFVVFLFYWARSKKSSCGRG